MRNYYFEVNIYVGSTPGHTLGVDIGHDFLADVVSYTEAGTLYVVSFATSFSLSGSTTSSIDKYPVARLPNTNAWHKKDPFNLSSDIAIIRFNVTTIEDNLSVEEEKQALSITLFSNS